MMGAETTSSGKLFHWLMTLCVKKLALVAYIAVYRVSNGGLWYEMLG